MTPTHKCAYWVNKKVLLEMLQIGKNGELELRRDGIFKPGIHYRRKSEISTQSSPLVYDIQACETALRDKAKADARRFEVYFDD